MFFLLLAGCPTPKDTGSDDTAAATGCDYGPDAPRLALAWDEDASSGVSAADAFDPGISSFSQTVYWDDGTSSDVTVTFAALAAREVVNAADCPVAIEADVAWAVEDEDRIALAGTITWFLDDTARSPEANVVGFTQQITAEDLQFTPFQDGSRFDLGAWYYVDDARLVFSVVEWWELDEVTLRRCLRVSASEGALGCTDEDNSDE